MPFLVAIIKLFEEGMILKSLDLKFLSFLSLSSISSIPSFTFSISITYLNISYVVLR